MTGQKEIFLGITQLKDISKEVRGEIITLNGEDFYKISNFLEMSPFLIAVVSDSDHWMYVSSYGGLTCGRKNPDFALFPYVTDDKIHDSSANTGPKTILLIGKNDKTSLWEPFELKHKGIYRVEQNLYKNIYGNKLLFEEINHDLKIGFSYAWMNSEKYGFVRESRIFNLDNKHKIEVWLLDGLRNLMPYGVNRGLQANMSTLVDGYKKCEADENTGMGIFTLSAILSDKAEPSEALKATTVWQSGLSKPEVLLSMDQFENFSKGMLVTSEKKLKGRRGNYFVKGSFILNEDEDKKWVLLAEVNQGPSEVVQLRKVIGDHSVKDILDDISVGTEKLKTKVSAADGFQHTSDPLVNSRHYSNTLFNIMRGGIFSNNYHISRDDLQLFIRKWNKPVSERYEEFIASLPDQILHSELIEKIREIGNPDLLRLGMEYLPLTFGRRHGDPSRPWNLFSIDIKNPDGTENIYYQGNWRDIFQNWHALSLSYPEFIENFIVKFVNASTADGYNPYRIANDGFDWEVPDPDDPWANIGYWGDHQLIYLLNLMELSARYHPGLLNEMLHKEIFVYANVPYRIKTYAELIVDPRNSVDYNFELAETIQQKVAKIGSDGKLYTNQNGEIYRVNLAEKILVSCLAKISNFVPGGGIWMSTQRPEWNDANNALVGYGLSMVTLYNLYRYLNFLIKIFEDQTETAVSVEVFDFFESLNQVFEIHSYLLNGKISDKERKIFMDSLGLAGEKHRLSVYNGFSGNRKTIRNEKLLEFLRLCRLFIYQTIKLNKRKDGLYHSYNLIHFHDEGYAVETLYEMLEGQVALLGSGYLSPEEGVELLDALRYSKMYQPGQKSYMLYPDRELPAFLEKNLISADRVRQSDFLINQVEQRNTRYIERDIDGKFHFNGNFRNTAELREALHDEPEISPGEIETICKIYFDLFDHKSFTGRSGTFYKYEGLGSIYWHMVSKLLLAVQELWSDAVARNTKKPILEKIKSHYELIKAGLGTHKTPAEYGAFPTDPYSHTPGFAGVQQPGMTGQVKEDFISRFGELGVHIENGMISFIPSLLNKKEFIDQPEDWSFLQGNQLKTMPLQKGSLGFLLCGIPVIYQFSEKQGIEVEFKDGKKTFFSSFKLDNITSKLIFSRKQLVGSVRLLIHQD